MSGLFLAIGSPYFAFDYSKVFFSCVWLCARARAVYVRVLSAEIRMPMQFTQNFLSRTPLGSWCFSCRYFSSYCAPQHAYLHSTCSCIICPAIIRFLPGFCTCTQHMIEAFAAYKYSEVASTSFLFLFGPTLYFFLRFRYLVFLWSILPV